MKSITTLILSATLIATSASAFAVSSKPQQPVVAEGGYERTPAGQRVAEGGYERTPAGQRVAEGGYERTPAGQRVAEGGADRLREIQQRA
ncbi:hypothetical protein ACQKPE_03705 [Pseudomonas sp. NPDC089554]|uniref:hypothetical protein n=1 Tax=Pseudomonas sp. NPDC089554 TaxID=3390653 RepID=UPI003D05A212